MFNATILTPERILFQGDAWSIFLPGDTGEFEILDLHKPITSLLKEGNIIVDWKKEIPIRAGAVKMVANQLVAIVEE